jgi:L-fucose isomerase-like protein
MMTNIYPVLMGMAALKHEGIPAFPEILDKPENHILLAHCGYFGLAPQSFCSSWCVKNPVLGIVDEQAHALDARYPTGPITMVKLDATMERLMVIEGDLKGYVQYPGSDCRNGAIVQVPDGHKLMRNIYSHHQILIPGHHKHMIETFAPVFGLTVDVL